MLPLWNQAILSLSDLFFFLGVCCSVLPFTSNIECSLLLQPWGLNLFCMQSCLYLFDNLPRVILQPYLLLTAEFVEHFLDFLPPVFLHGVEWFLWGRHEWRASDLLQSREDFLECRPRVRLLVPAVWSEKKQGVLVKQGCPWWQQSQNLAKLLDELTI